MTETEAALAKATYEKIIGSKQLFLLGQIEAILAVAEMSDSLINGAIHSVNVVKPSQEARSKVASYTADDILRLYFANILYQKFRTKKMEKSKTGVVTVLWRDVGVEAVPSMLRSKKEELVFDSEVGQKLVKKMAEIAGI